MGDIVWQGDHFEVVKMEDDYEAVHEADSVMMLPKIGDQIIVRLEPCPPYQIKGNHEYYWTPVSGTREEGEHVFETLKREMGEETPILPERIRVLREMRSVPHSKLTTERISFFAFDVLEYEETGAPGDGSKYEDESKHVFVTKSKMLKLSTSDNADLSFRFCAEILKNI